MADSHEMEDFNEDESKRRFMDIIEVSMVQPDQQKHGSSSSSEETMEKTMDEALENGDLDGIKKRITPYNLTKCATNSLEKSFEVSRKLNDLSSLKSRNEEEFKRLATSVEEFALKLLDPLKSDKEKRATFEEGFDRVLDKAVKCRQKKFVSHPVVYNFMMKQRWTGNSENNSFKWILLNFWTFFDVFLFPVVFLLLRLIHLVTGVGNDEKGSMTSVAKFNEGRECRGRSLLKKEKSSTSICRYHLTLFTFYQEYFTTPYFIFFRDTLSYMALLGLHFAMCLQPSTIQFTAIEWIIAVFFLGRFMMETNQVITEKNSKSTDKTIEWKELCRIVSSYFDDWWNRLDVVALVVFLILVGLRVFTWSEHTSVSKNRILAVAGYLYGLNAMFLTLRVFGHIMEVNRSTGSIQIALFHIIGTVITIFGQFLAATLAFSLAITKIYMAEVSYNSGPNGTSNGVCENKNGFACWWSSTTHLAWSLLGMGELTPLESSDDASDFLAKLLYGLFLVMGVVMLMNMMIALLSNTYQNVQDNALYEWSYKRATTIRTYIKYHPVPVPFNVISLSFKMIRHIYRTINCKRCEITEMYPAQDSQVSICFKYLISHLQDDYFAEHGYKFPDDNKLDLILKETDGSHQLIGHIAERVFLYGQIEMQLLESHGPSEWKELEGIKVIGQRLIHIERESKECVCCGGDDTDKCHGAKYLNPLSEDCPGFEVLIQENGKRRFIGIGIVTEKYSIDIYPGWEGNTAGYHIDDGRIFDSEARDGTCMGPDAMAHRGDLLGCKILYDKQKDNKLPVSFTLNGRDIGKANVTNDGSFFYPFVVTGWKGISLLFKLCPKVPLPRADTNPETISQRLQKLEEKMEHLFSQTMTMIKANK